jgi:tRNA modification GTPase
MACEALVALEFRLADPGEFTRRAWENGRIAPSQIEAVADLIAAGSADEVSAAARVLAGESGARFRLLAERIRAVAAQVELNLDFLEQELPAHPWGPLADAIDHLASEARRGAAVEPGAGARAPRIGLFGMPNAGKSTLINRVTGVASGERQIEGDWAGLTRNVRGLPVPGEPAFDLCDMPGLEFRAEDQGVVLRELGRLDGAWVILDGTASDYDAGLRAFRRLPSGEALPHLVLLNKVDLLADDAPGDAGLRRVSAKTGLGIGDVVAATRAMLASVGAGAANGRWSATRRQTAALARIATELDSASMLLRDDGAAELVAFHLRAAADEAAAVIGGEVSEDTLNAIFAGFCIGK